MRGQAGKAVEREKDTLRRRESGSGQRRGATAVAGETELDSGDGEEGLVRRRGGPRRGQEGAAARSSEEGDGPV